MNASPVRLRHFLISEKKTPLVAWSDESEWSEEELAPGQWRGIPTGPANGFWVLDLDIKNDKDGTKALIAFCEQKGHNVAELATFAVKTMNGGCHLYFTYDKPVKTCSNVGGLKGVDVRGDGGYVVSFLAPGYSIAPIAQEPKKAPDWLYDLVTPNSNNPAPATPTAVTPIDPSNPQFKYRCELARDYLKGAKPCVSEDRPMIGIAIHLIRRYELSPENAYEIFKESGYNDKCKKKNGEPYPWTEKEVLHKFNDAAAGRLGADVIPGAMREGWTLGKSDLVEPLEDGIEGAQFEYAPRDVQRTPVHMLLGKALHQIVEEAQTYIGNDPAIFQRGGKLVRLVHVAEDDADRAHVAGLPTIQAVGTPWLKNALSGTCDFLARTDKGTFKSVKPPPDVVAAVLEAGEYRTTRVLSGITEAPLLRPDGSILQAPGYDSATGYVFEPAGVKYQDVPEAPTQDDAKRALASLQEVFRDFPYADDSSRDVPIAALLTLIGRPAVQDNVPLFVFDASTAGSGKTLQADAVSLIATGRLVSKATWSSSDEEVEKILGGYARQGVNLFCFDNVASKTPLGGAPLDKYLTCGDTVEVRILGQTANANCKWRGTIFASGNNVSFKGDTMRRTIISRLVPDCERPEERSAFKHPDLKSWVADNRPRLVVAALTILRAYVLAGKPPCGVSRLGSFETWSELIPAAIVWSGGGDVTKSRPEDDGGSTDLAREVIAQWPESSGFMTRDVLLRSQQGAGEPFGAALSAFLAEELDGEPPTEHRVAHILKSIKDRVYDSKRFLGKSAKGKGKSYIWSVKPVQCEALGAA
jgi:hypothetical protein